MMGESDMMRALIVDDEPSCPLGLAHHVNWFELGYEQPAQVEEAALAGNMTEVDNRYKKLNSIIKIA
jgi:hypothetical protein